MIGLLDSGATNGFFSKTLVEEKGMDTEALPLPVPVYNADGSLNEAGMITHVTHLRLHVEDHSEILSFAVTNTGKSDVIIGYNWLKKKQPGHRLAEGKSPVHSVPAGL